jgi:hypothetical protein
MLAKLDALLPSPSVSLQCSEGIHGGVASSENESTTRTGGNDVTVFPFQEKEDFKKEIINLGITLAADSLIPSKVS